VVAQGRLTFAGASDIVAEDPRTALSQRSQSVEVTILGKWLVFIAWRHDSAHAA